MGNNKRSHDGYRYEGPSLDHSHRNKYNVCSNIKKEYCATRECIDRCLNDLSLDAESYVVDFFLPSYGNIRLKPAAFKKKGFEKFSPISVEKFFTSLNSILQIDILPCPNLPLLRIYVGKAGYRYLPIELFLEALPDSISKKFLGAETLIDKAKIAIKAFNKKYNFSRK